VAVPHRSGAHRTLRSFPTRRSSDLGDVVARAAAAIVERTRLTPDFPAPGVLFRDLTPVLGHPASLLLVAQAVARLGGQADLMARSEEHTSELQSRENLVCRLLLEKK